MPHSAHKLKKYEINFDELDVNTKAIVKAIVMLNDTVAELQAQLSNIK